jgi:hypothetical protein
MIELRLINGRSRGERLDPGRQAAFSALSAASWVEHTQPCRPPHLSHFSDTHATKSPKQLSCLINQQCITALDKSTCLRL